MAGGRRDGGRIAVWDVLAERGFELMLVNARHVKMVPGRKTDRRDMAG